MDERVFLQFSMIHTSLEYYWQVMYQEKHLEQWGGKSRALSFKTF